MRAGAIVLAACVLALAGCAAPARHAASVTFADPADQVIAAERGFSALAQSAGQWTAFRATAHPDALMLLPHPVRAHDWLAGRTDPQRAARWWPALVAVSCDGTTALSSGGAISPNGEGNRFITIWQRQPDGRWQWVMDRVMPVAAPPVEPAAVQRIAGDCAEPPAVPPSAMSVAQGLGSDSGGGQSPDESLRWHWAIDERGALHFVVDLRRDRRYVRVIEDGAPHSQRQPGQAG
jgi:hypothetical protein